MPDCFGLHLVDFIEGGSIPGEIFDDGDDLDLCPLTLQRHLIYSWARCRGNLFILAHLRCSPTVVEPPSPISLEDGGSILGNACGIDCWSLG